MLQFLILLALALLYFAWNYMQKFAKKNDPIYADKLEQANREIGELQTFSKIMKVERDEKTKELATLQEQFEKLRFNKISADVKLGQKAEQLAGLLENFPAPLHTLKFLGAPIDYVSIDLEKELIIFIEVKTGQSRLSDTQKKIRKIIKDKNVEFREFRI